MPAALVSLASASMHGRDVDDLLRLFLGIVVLAMLLVHVGLVVVWLRRGGDSRMAWAPIAAGVMTLGLVVMFAVSERHWRQLKDNRSELSQATDVQRLLVIGERFACWSRRAPAIRGPRVFRSYAMRRGSGAS
ncbi:MAG: hypothetical protein AAF561_09615 [Planctomycetota bacterium]